MQAQCFAREGRVLALESGGERLLLGPRACFDAVAPQLLIQDEAAMRMALEGFLRDSHAYSRLASWVGTVEGGGLFDSWRYGADQAAPRVAAMAQSGAIAGMIVPLGQGDAPTPSPAQDLGMPAGPVSSWSLEARFRYVLTHMPAYLSGEARQAFAQLLEPAALATTVAVLVVWAGSHAVGVGFVADAALLGIGFALVGWAIFDAIGALADFFHQTLNAQSTDDLDQAAQSLARCVTTIGVGALIALLTRGAGRLMSRGGDAGGAQQPGAGLTEHQTPSNLRNDQSRLPASGPEVPEGPQVNGKPEWLQRMDRGNAFNAERAPAYPHNEVYINKPSGSGYYRLDSYHPANREIVSRKFTQFSDISERTAVGYINEVPAKYPVGGTIANVPSSGNLGGQVLQGQHVLEVPVQVRPVPQGVIDAADQAGVLIRDVNGRIY